MDKITANFLTDGFSFVLAVPSAHEKLVTQYKFPVASIIALEKDSKRLSEVLEREIPDGYAATIDDRIDIMRKLVSGHVKTMYGKEVSVSVSFQDSPTFSDAVSVFNLVKMSRSLRKNMSKKYSGIVIEYFESKFFGKKMPQLVTAMLMKLEDFLYRVLFRIKTFGRKTERMDLDYDNGVFLSVEKAVKNLITDRFELKSKIAYAAHIVATCEDKDLEKAIDAVISDLEKLNEKKLIMGSLIDLNVISLKDTIGNGNAVYCVISSPILYRELYSNPDLVGSLGIKYLTKEGDVSYLNGIKPFSDWKIEEVYLLESSPIVGRVIQ